MLQARDEPKSAYSLQSCLDLVDYFTPIVSHPKISPNQGIRSMNCDACVHVLTTVTTFVHTNWPNPLIFKAFCVAAFKMITLTG